MTSKQSHPTPVQKQIVLPLSKAAEIAYKSIRLRLTRSLVVIAGIILALAFLTSILMTDAVGRGMRQWIAQTAASPDFAALQRQRRDLETQLPALAAAAKQSGASSAAVAAWKSAADQLAQTREALNSPRVLDNLMKKSGSPTTATEVREDHIQTLWRLGLAMLIAFIGILNAMLMSVTERFREIGTMKCLGALDGFIIRLFLLESLFMGAVGTVAGILLGSAVALATQTFIFGGYAWKNAPLHEMVLLCLACFAAGTALTVGAALYPAWQAARMQPIAAMRVEA